MIATAATSHPVRISLSVKIILEIEKTIPPTKDLHLQAASVRYTAELT